MLAFLEFFAEAQKARDSMYHAIDFHEKMPATAEFRLRPQRRVGLYNHVKFTPIAKGHVFPR